MMLGIRSFKSGQHGCKFILTTSSFCLLLVVLTCCSPMLVSASMVLKNEHGKCLASEENNGSSGTVLIQQECRAGETGQQWRREDDKYYCNGWDLCLASPGNLRTNSGRLVQWEKTREQGQFWRPSSRSWNGGHRMANAWGNCLSVVGDSDQNGAHVEARSCLPLGAEKGQIWTHLAL